MIMNIGQRLYIKLSMQEMLAHCVTMGIFVIER